MSLGLLSACATTHDPSLQDVMAAAAPEPFPVLALRPFNADAGMVHRIIDRRMELPDQFGGGHVNPVGTPSLSTFEALLALESLDQLRGHPGDVQAAALASWTEATEAVRKYRSEHP